MAEACAGVAIRVRRVPHRLPRGHERLSRDAHLPEPDQLRPGQLSRGVCTCVFALAGPNSRGGPSHPWARQQRRVDSPPRSVRLSRFAFRVHSPALPCESRSRPWPLLSASPARDRSLPRAPRGDPAGPGVLGPAVQGPRSAHGSANRRDLQAVGRGARRCRRRSGARALDRYASLRGRPARSRSLALSSHPLARRRARDRGRADARRLLWHAPARHRVGRHDRRDGASL